MGRQVDEVDDTDPNNPVDNSDEKWTEIYSREDYDEDHDYSMNG